jgi:hypothetical protein
MIIHVKSSSTPDQAGYQDKGAVFSDGGDLLWHGAMSCCPNPHTPINQCPWQKEYGWLACGEYDWQCIDSPRHGKCLLLGGGGELPARMPNFNHNGRMVVTEIMVHKGFSDTWRGSAACLTVSPNLWPGFIDFFKIDDKGKIVIQHSEEV